MRFGIGVAGLMVVGVSGWYIGSRLSPDAIGMAVGILFGIMAGIPAAIMVMASRRQADRQYEQHGFHQPYGSQGRKGRGNQIAPYGQMPYGQQPPVIVVTGNPPPHQYSPNQMGQGYPAQVYPMPNQHYDVDATNVRALSGPVDPAYSQPSERKFRVVGEQEEWIDGF